MKVNQPGGINTITKINSTELDKYDDNMTVFITKNIVCTEIAKLQNTIKSDADYEKLFLLMDSLHISENENMSNKFALKFIEVTVKVVNECFPHKSIPIYIDD